MNLQTQFLTRQFGRLILAVMTLSLALTSPPQGGASSAFRTANGYFDTTISDEYTLLGTIGSDTFYREDLTFLYGGDMVGTATDVNYIILHADGSFESVASEVCTGCTLGGKTGSFTAVYYIDGADFFNLDYTGYFAFTRGTGGLAGLSGLGTFGGANVDYSYSYQYRFGR